MMNTATTLGQPANGPACALDQSYELDRITSRIEILSVNIAGIANTLAHIADATFGSGTDGPMSADVPQPTIYGALNGIGQALDRLDEYVCGVSTQAQRFNRLAG